MSHYRNLTFRGGGILGIAYLGALEVLDAKENNILKDIRRVSGASAGAITALVTCICDSATEIKNMADSLQFAKVPEITELKLPFSRLKIAGMAEDDLIGLSRLFHQYGWYSSNYFHSWLVSVIDKQFQASKAPDEVKKKNGMQTFQDLRTAGFRDLYVSVTNVSLRQNKIFSIETKPSMPVADAVRMSMSIPLYFESVEYEGERFADGGVTNNFPIEIFDDRKYLSDASNFVDDINMESLGCHLYNPEKKPRKSDTLIHYIEEVFATLMSAQAVAFDKSPNLHLRSANISDLGISPLDFNITKDDSDRLYQSGKSAMQEFLKTKTT